MEIDIDKLVLAVAEAAAEDIADGLRAGERPGGDGMPAGHDGRPNGYRTGVLADGIRARSAGSGVAHVVVPASRAGAVGRVWGDEDPFPQGGIDVGSIAEALQEVADAMAEAAAAAITAEGDA